MDRHNEVISLEYRVNKAFEGKYFIGHTPVVPISGGVNAWAGLFNPNSSGVNLFVNTFTVSNFSPTPFATQLWLNSTPSAGSISPFVSSTNTAKNPLPRPKANVVYARNVISTPSNGASILTRIAEGNSTTVGNYYGKIIIPPGGLFVVFLYSPGAQPVQAEVAFGWWEETT